jgi:methylmalonyl-CoA/ethylmalonyl-CoA epimerase
MQNLIAQLESASREDREAAARELYRAGRARGEQATAAWWAVEELRSLFTGVITVGLAVEEARFAAIRAAWGEPPLADVPPEQDAQEFEVEAHGAAGFTAQLDILTSRTSDPNGAIRKFLSKNGEGIQQVEFDVKDVDRACAIVRDLLGVKFVYPQTRPGAGGTRVNFFLASAADGGRVLIELVEKASRA